MYLVIMFFMELLSVCGSAVLVEQECGAVAPRISETVGLYVFTYNFLFFMEPLIN